MDPRPFTARTAASAEDDLRARLAGTRWSSTIGGDPGHYGIDGRWLRDMVGWWHDEFDWQAQLAEMNALPQYVVEIGDQTVHFVHVRGAGEASIPIVLTHGWPWTFWDWKAVIGPLTDPQAHGLPPWPSFDVVVPSLPGFGHSLPMGRAPVDAGRIADTWHVLMQQVLGYERYGAGGGDWGAIVTGEVGARYGDQLLGVWLTLPYVPGVDLRGLGPADFASDEEWMWQRMTDVRPTIQSHRTVHVHEPQTLAYALADSPVGLAAWIWSRRWNWADHGGDPLEVFSREFLCATASLYWFNDSVSSSLRVYQDHFGRPAAVPADHPAITAPTGFSVFPGELLFLPRRMAERVTNLHHWNVLPRGGHFAPAEQPALVVDELRRFFGGVAPRSAGSPAR